MHERVRRRDKECTTWDIFRTLKTPMIKARIQATNTALFIFSSFMFGYCIVNLIARSLSRVTSIRWKYEAVTITITVVEKQISTVPLSLRPEIGKSSTGQTMVGQGDQLRRQSPLNRPAKRCCWYGVEASISQLLSPIRWVELWRDKWWC